MQKVARALVIYCGMGLYTGSLFACNQTSLSSTPNIPTPLVAYTPIFDALPSNDLPMEFGMMFGGSVHDQARSVAITSDNRVVVGVNTADSLSFLGVAPTEKTSAAGKIIQFNSEGTAVLRIVGLGERVDDIQASPRTQEIFVGGDMGVMALTDDLSVKWEQPLAEFSDGNGRSDGGKTKVSVAEDGSAAVIRSKNVIFLSPEGEILRSVKVERSFVNDVAIAPDGKTAYVVGYRNATRNNVPVQIAFLYAYEVSTGKRLWRLWDFEANLVGNDMADSRLYHVKVGADGVVHVAGESAGGNTIYRWNGQDLSTPTLVNTDKYHHAYQTRANHITYYGQVDPTEQKVIRGQLAIPRRSNNDGNTARVRDGALEVDQAGTVFISGRASASLPNRDQQQINGENAGSYGGGEPFLLMVSADLSTRYRWAPLAESGGFASGTAPGLVVRNGVGYLLATITQGAGFTTPGVVVNSAPNQADKNLSDVYLAKFRPYE
ncbi:MAG: hypothetical protein QNJ46_07305 [Leptolyngbyaceae cyanobacterium MO_188.B28]|nr:hypothetical protein [Leptolyngbyaceae cyanobacterium MO_188.B28]